MSHELQGQSHPTIAERGGEESKGLSAADSEVSCHSIQHSLKYRGSVDKSVRGRGTWPPAPPAPPLFMWGEDI